VVLRENRPPEEVAAFIAAFPMISVLAGIGAAAATAALNRYLKMVNEVITTAQRCAAASARARLARELHDSVAKTLRGVSFAALALPSSLRCHPRLAEQLANTVAGGRGGCPGGSCTARGAPSRRTRPGLPIHGPSDLPSLVRITGITTSVVADNLEPSVPLRYEFARILQEALLNVERHADADRVQVRLTAIDRLVELSVWDSGTRSVLRDLTALQAGGHFGIVGMTERAKAVHGSFQVSSAPGAHTLVTVRAPLDGTGTPALYLLTSPDGRT
jgi:signal transduction histidine kinase